MPISVSTAVLRDHERLVGGVEIFRDTSEVEGLRKELSGSRVFADMVGVSRPMQELFALLPSSTRHLRQSNPMKVWCTVLGDNAWHAGC
jgi:hypothetical protein